VAVEMLMQVIRGAGENVESQILPIEWVESDSVAEVGEQ
jgi:hypothetical protein